MYTLLDIYSVFAQKPVLKMFIPALVIITQSRKQHKVLQWEMVKQMAVHPPQVEYYSATKKKELVIHATTQMNLQGSMLSE